MSFPPKSQQRSPSGSLALALSHPALGLARTISLGLLVAVGMASIGCGSSTTTTGSADGGSRGDSQASEGGHDGRAHDATSDTQDAAKDARKDTGTKRDATGDGTTILHEGGEADGPAGDAIPTIDAGSCPPDGSAPDAVAMVDCTGKCGPVVDHCTGATAQCGGCSPTPSADGGPGAPVVCDLTTNTCGPALTTCAELGAACGTVLNSCGSFLDCPDGTTKGCPAGQECNTDTNQCQACEQVTCADLGYQCGFAWLGCGPDVSSNYTDCGTCGGTQVCNDVFNICEPDCTPGTAAALCTAAGAQCGVITNGCGGTVDCDNVPGGGCPMGQSCGVLGEANQCDPAVTPVECVGLGRTCGTITSACTGQAISCGTCAAGEVCNTNGVCGPPCTPKTCTDFSDLDCGTFPDGCGNTVTCGTCEGGICNETTHTCCDARTCNGDYANQCGTALANGCGTGSLSCPCPSGDVCTQNGGDTAPPASGTPGACCTPTKTTTTYGAANECGTNLPDGCGGNDVTVTCPNGGECVSGGAAPAPGVVGTCCTPAGCGSVASGTCKSIPDSCISSKTIACDECVSPQTCVGGDECCTPAPACAANVCNTTTKSPNCGSPRTCGCGNGETCVCSGGTCTAMSGAGTCEATPTCGSKYPGKCGTDLTNGIGGELNCPCGAGMKCSSTTNGTAGTCACDNGLGAPYTCANVPNGPHTGGPQCGSFDNGCGGMIDCGCTSPDVCDKGSCCAPTTCPTNPGVGAKCGSLGNGCGGPLNCGCTGADICDNGACCAPTACPVNPGVGAACGKVSNGCGGSNMCGCSGTDTCDPMTGLCCAPTSCPATPAIGTACGSVSNACGGTNQCGCPSGTGNENFTCTAGACACTADTCLGRVGAFPDGCGGTINCSG